MEFIQAFEEWKQILQLNRKTERKIPAQLLHCENKFDKASNLKKFLQRKFSLSLI
jgi:lipopolysaccharide biosynthesis regulator YciM